MKWDEVNWDAWTPCWRATLLFVVRDDQILLIHKKRGLGAGKINAPGGRIEPGETLLEAAIREVREELRITPRTPEERGHLRFQFTDGLSIEVHVFRSDSCDGEPAETDEAAPLWVPTDAVPYDRMWEDDRVWLPHFLAGKFFRGRFLFDGDCMKTHALTVFDSFDAWRASGE